MKRILFFALIFVIVAFALASCDSSKNAEKEYIFDAEDHWIKGENEKENHRFNDEKCNICGFNKAYTVGVEYELSHDMSFYYVIGYTGSSEIVVIEKEVDGIPVTSIMSNSFSKRSGIKKIIIPDSVTEIRMYAFAYCTDLESIVIPDSVVNASGYLFTGCEKLSDIVFPDGIRLTNLESFQGTAYYNNEANWDNGVLYVGKHLIKVDENYSGTLVIRDGTQTIASDALKNCENIEEVVIPSTVKTIGMDAFKGCKSLKSINIPESVIQISSGAFRDCTSLEEVVLSENLQLIYSYAFKGCEKLAKIIIPSTVIEVGNEAFGGCPELVIYCRFSNRPIGWSATWIGGSNEVHWNYTGE